VELWLLYKLFESLNPVCQTPRGKLVLFMVFASNTTVPTGYAYEGHGGPGGQFFTRGSAPCGPVPAAGAGAGTRRRITARGCGNAVGLT